MSNYDPNVFKNTWQDNCWLAAGYIVPPIAIAMIAVIILTKFGAFNV